MQRIDLRQPMSSVDGRAPIVIHVEVPRAESYSEGVPDGARRVEHYVLFSALPADLQRRVDMAVQALVAGM